MLELQNIMHKFICTVKKENKVSFIRLVWIIFLISFGKESFFHKRQVHKSKKKNNSF